MIRRFYSDTTNPATGTRDKVTALRVHPGEWVVNEIAKTKIVDGYFYDKPGKYLGLVRKAGSKWNVSSPEDGNVPGFGTLASAVAYMMTREEQRA